MVAFVDRRPRIPLPGLRRTTLTQVRSILGLPATDIELPPTDTAPTDRSTTHGPIEAVVEWVGDLLRRVAALWIAR